MSRPVLLLSAVAGCLLIASPAAKTASACSVPVYRYALERWPSDPYRVVIFHRGGLTKQQQKLADDLGPDGLAGEKFANVVLRTVDLAGKVDEEMLALWKSQKNAKLPWMVARYPNTVPYAPAWSGPLSRAAVDGLLDSPVRRELAKRLLAGESSVWILLESGDKQKDEAAWARLKKNLAFEQKNLKLPEIDDADLLGDQAKDEIAKLRVHFSIIRVSRKDPKESMLVEMLLGSEGSGRDSLRDPEYVHQTMAFPIFGRGRIRYGLVGAGIAEDTIHAACAYLTGPCKCQIKQGVENRGMDLVMSVDWERMVAPTIRDPAAAPLVGLGTFKSLLPEPREPVPAPKPRPTRLAEGPAGKPTGTGEADKPDRAAETSPAKPAKDEPNAGEAASADAAAAIQFPAGEDAASQSPSSEGGGPLSRNMIIMFTLAALVVVAASFALLARKT